MAEAGNSFPQLKGTGRMLAAVMFADMMGYTAMMQEDEDKARAHRDRMQAVQEKLIPQYSGQIISRYGDGTLSLFSSATAAVQCAILIQQELQQAPQVNVRIGLHTGDVYYDDLNIYGDCVNLTSRIEALGIAGGVLISGKLQDEIKNQKDITTVSLGSYQLKNVKQPVEIYAVTNKGLLVPSGSQLGVRVGSEKSIAVMPFINMSADPENEYFSDGMAEEILNALTRVEGLQVCSRSSSFTYKGKNQDPKLIGKELGVAFLLEGSVRRAGNKVRITANLASAVDGYQLWSEVYDGSLDDVFMVQDEISAKIVARLRADLAQQERKEPRHRKPTENLDAYNLYLKGRFHWNKSNPEEIQKAIDAFEQAIALDPNYTEAYCMLSYCYSFLGSSGLMPRQEGFTKATGYTLKAIELDPAHAESHLSLGIIKFFQNWDFAGANESVAKAIQLGLNSSLLHQIEGMILIARGEFESAIAQMTLALKQDPLSLPLMTSLADAYAFGSRFEEAIKWYDKVIELDPTFRRAFEGKGMVYMALQDYPHAIENLEHYHKLVGHPLKGLSGLGVAYARAGLRDKSMEVLDKLNERQRQEPNTNLNLEFGFIYTGLGEQDKAFEYLRKSFEQRMGIACTGLIFCIRYPLLNDSIKSDPRFASLVEEFGMKI